MAFELMYFVKKMNWFIQFMYQMKISHMPISKVLTDLCIKKRDKNLKHFYRYCLQCFSRCITRGGGGRGEVSPALFLNLKKSALNLGKNALTRFIMGFTSRFKCCLKHIQEKFTEISPCEAFLFCMLLIKYLSKSPYFQKPPLP